MRSPAQDLASDAPDRALLDKLAARLEVEPGKVLLADSLAAYVAAGLADAPRLADRDLQMALTERHLQPAMRDVEALFRHVRAAADPGLRRRLPHMGGNPYPLGRCLEITQAVEQALARACPEILPAGAGRGLLALQRFRAAGGQIRRAWGDLRGEYFQNALLVGGLYVDVANDTVVPTKPPVEIRPFEAADFRPIADHAHFARIAARYWGYRFLPNHLLPEVAPYLPLIQITPAGAMKLGPFDMHMLARSLESRFVSAAAVLGADAWSPELFASVAARLRAGGFAVAPDPQAGRAAALAECARQGAGDGDLSPEAFNRAVVQGRAAQRLLDRLALRALAA